VLSRFFIDRPIFAWVIAIIIMLAGVIAIYILPIQQYPNIAPPTVSINTTLPGASAETLENSVTQVIEQALIGIDYLRYFNSTSDSAGNVAITLTFEQEANPDIAQVQVQNKVQSIISLLPNDVQQQGIKVTKSNPTILMVAGFYSENGELSQAQLGDILSSKVQDAVSRVNGVGNVTVFGQPHSMRIWLNPHKLLSYNLTAMDAITAIKAQNIDISAGQIGGLPSIEGQRLTATITAQSQLQTVKDFENIILRVNSDGGQIRVKDIARVEIGSQAYDKIVRYNRQPAAGIGITLANGANAIETSDLVKAKIASFMKILPPSVKVVYPLDTTPFVKISIREVVKTLIEAVILVFLIMYLFLQNFRATLIPSLTVPIVLLGTFAVLAGFGYSINTLTMFAMVLAIGLLVDDAIVVIENVERIMEEEKLSPREATHKSMGQITGALIGIALVLTAVFIPMAFFKGSTGVIYRQFSITIVSAMILSVLIALILTPSLCATILKPVSAKHTINENGFFKWFNTNFNHTREIYLKGIKFVMGRQIRFFAIYGLLIGGLILMFLYLPTSFLPDEDQGTMYAIISTPPGSTSERTLESVKQIEDYFLGDEKDNIRMLFTVTGYSYAGTGQNAALGFAGLKSWNERKKPDQTVFAVVKRSMQNLSKIKDATIFTAFPPAINGLGNFSGFDFQLIDHNNLGHHALIQARNQLLEMASKNPKLMGVRPNGLEDVAQYQLDIDHEKAMALGINVDDINNTLQDVWGGVYINDFLDAGRIKKVYVQADAPYRMSEKNINDWYVRNSEGKMISFSSFTNARWTYGPQKLERFNGESSINIQGASAAGISSGEAMIEMENIATRLPQGIGFAWTGLSYEEKVAGSQAPKLYAFSLLIVFLSLAALYESWSIPLSVIFIVPIGVVGALVATILTGHKNDVYFQVGLLTTIGLASKNAILIVELAKAKYEEGLSLIEAATLASHQRFRPIMMTSVAFILGVAPLALSSGAGSGSQNALGTGVIGGMLAATFLAIFFVPLFFIAVNKIFKTKLSKEGQ
jgi:multidrug efflux pump